MAKFDYRQYYKDYYSIEFDGRKFEVHHIDKNRSNNDISNLILLPTSLHKLFHANELGSILLSDPVDERIFRDWYLCNELQKYASIAYKIGFWTSFKNNLDNYKRIGINPLELSGYSYPDGILGKQ